MSPFERVGGSQEIAKVALFKGTVAKLITCVDSIRENNG